MPEGVDVHYPREYGWAETAMAKVPAEQGYAFTSEDVALFRRWRFQ